MNKYPELALLGDYNIAPDDRDVHDPAAWEGMNLVSPPERAAFQALLDLGLSDSFRQFGATRKRLSVGGTIVNGFRLNKGVRIDHVPLSKPLAGALYIMRGRSRSRANGSNLQIMHRLSQRWQQSLGLVQEKLCSNPTRVRLAPDSILIVIL